MERLPTETLVQIFDFLTPNDILNLPFHVTMAGLTRDNARRRFSRTRIWIHKGSLNRLVRISLHPLISSCVEELVIGTQRPGYLPQADSSDEEWFQARSQPQKIFQLAPELSNDARLTEGALEGIVGSNFRDQAKISSQQLRHLTPTEKYTLSINAYKEQLRFQESGLDQAMLTVAFVGLSALKRIGIDNNLRDVRERDEYDEYDYDDEGPDANQNTAIIDNDPHEGYGGHLVAILMQSLASSGLAIESFQIRSDKHDFSYPDGIVRVSVTDMIRCIPAVSKSCQSMKELDLLSIFYNEQEARDGNIPWPEFGSYDTSFNASNEVMHSILSSAALLEKFSLFCINDIGYPSIMTEPTLPLKTLLASNKLQNLRNLNLSTFKTQQDELVGFLKTCAPTLRSLQLRHIHLIRGTWLAAFRDLKGLFQLGNSSSHVRRLQDFRHYGSHKIEEGLSISDLFHSGPEVFKLIRKTGPQMGFDSHDLGQNHHLLDWFCGRCQLNPYWKHSMGNRHFRAASCWELDADGLIVEGTPIDNELDFSYGARPGKWNGTCWGHHKVHPGIICNFNNGWDVDYDKMEW